MNKSKKIVILFEIRYLIFTLENINCNINININCNININWKILIVNYWKILIGKY